MSMPKDVNTKPEPEISGEEAIKEEKLPKPKPKLKSYDYEKSAYYKCRLAYLDRE